MKIILSIFILSVALFANIGTVSLLKGSATIERSGNVFDIKVGNDIDSGDKINTDTKSKMQIILNDDTIITLGASTEYIINSYSDKNDPHAEMTLKKGLLKTITGKIGKIAPSRFKLKTKSATIGVRGTGWKTYVGVDVENIVCFKGVITITMDEITFDLPKGNMIFIRDGVARRFKTNMRIFNAQIEEDRVDKTEDAKENEKLNMDILEELNLGILEDYISQITEEINLEVTTKAVNDKIEDSEPAFEIKPIVDTPQEIPEIPDPSTGP